ncbi:ribosome small subunit-dependent GTPase A [Piscinibacter sakaiensis]|uniref:Small ribosomal subunit biogenesis GTPase RsgA n=1 Tax=Piscinibacter sakaiensis TaxID=1547922 RepID=A0A0K8NYG7_PISS1|nr:ribosome small subunit-dependent GTPase A [Piscinibacter sakaiensis]GAP35339.1 putative GTPase [Piscinibacter sakaiensis]
MIISDPSVAPAGATDPGAPATPGRSPLAAIGLSPALAQRADATHAAAALAADCALRRVTEVHRDRLALHDGRAEQAGRLCARLRRDLADADAEIAVGDWVWAHPGADERAPWEVAARVPPGPLLRRRDGDGLRHTLVANVDLALLVMGLDADFNLRRLERYLVLVQGEGLAAAVVLTKADQAGPQATADALAAIDRRLAASTASPDTASGAPPALAVDATSATAAAALAPWLVPGRTLVLLGSSGAGKSTLTNTLLEADRRLTGAVRLHDGRGQHTTTVRTLFPLASGACVIDTPGLRALRPDLDPTRLADSFADVQRLAPLCRFRDCRHEREPGCAVREAVDPDRLDNLGRMLRDARRDTLDALQRRRLRGEWKARGRAGAERARQKRGEA